MPSPTKGVIATWLRIADLPAEKRADACCAALERTFPRRERRELLSYREELARKLPESRLRARVLQKLDVQLHHQRRTA